MRRRLMIVCHDAGGAEIVSSWLRREQSSWDATLVLQGPAREIFARKLGSRFAVRDDLPDPEVDFMLCGTSGVATLERDAIRAARAAGITCAAWLDHWTNYRHRFLDGPTLVLPDEVWVADPKAEALARRELPEAVIRLRGNPYLQDFADEVAELDRERAQPRAGGIREDDLERVLYVTEPTSVAAERHTGNPRGWGYTEHEALAIYLDHLTDLPERPPVRLRLRTHPAEASNKYDDLLSTAGAVVRLDPAPGATLAEDVSWSDTVVGCETMAMVAARAAGRRVLCVLPAGARPSPLPTAGIERLWPSAGNEWVRTTAGNERRRPTSAVVSGI